MSENYTYERNKIAVSHKFGTTETAKYTYDLDNNNNIQRLENICGDVSSIYLYTKEQDEEELSISHSGASLRYTNNYDANAGHLISSNITHHFHCMNPSFLLQYEYDNKGRLSSQSYQSQKTDYIYDAMGRINRYKTWYNTTAI